MVYAPSPRQRTLMASPLRDLQRTQTGVHSVISLGLRIQSGWTYAGALPSLRPLPPAPTGTSPRMAADAPGGNLYCRKAFRSALVQVRGRVVTLHKIQPLGDTGGMVSGPCVLGLQALGGVVLLPHAPGQFRLGDERGVGGQPHGLQAARIVGPGPRQVQLPVPQGMSPRPSKPPPGSSPPVPPGRGTVGPPRRSACPASETRSRRPGLPPTDGLVPSTTVVLGPKRHWEIVARSDGSGSTEQL